VLLASEGREFTAASIALAADLARAERRHVLVLSIARVHGVAFGLQTPGLMPTKAEWDEQREIVSARWRSCAARRAAEGQVLGTRKPAQRICALADELGAGAIVMGADRSRPRLIGSMMWSQEPQHVERGEDARAPGDRRAVLIRSDPDVTDTTFAPPVRATATTPAARSSGSQDGRVVHVRGDPDHPVSRGKLCRKCTLAYNGVFLDRPRG
jgi:nucleotide-binding universal stress UspA family protein